MKRGRTVLAIIAMLFLMTSTVLPASVIKLDEGRFNEFKGTIDGKYKNSHAFVCQKQ
jgi:hypothetical protein